MTTGRNRGEMPFLDHLEELRWRILWCLLALIAGTLAGFWLVQHYDVIGLLKRPIEPYLPDGRLHYLRPADPFFITFKLALLVGLLLSAPVIVWQVWSFLSPALYAREKRYIIPVSLAALVLFAGGATLSYRWVLPAAFKLLLGFQRADLEPIITADAYFSFAAQLILAFGLSFELPLIIMMLAAIGIVTPAFLGRNRRYWIVIAALAAALITPTGDPLTMMAMMVPLVLLYEVGILLARLVARRRNQESGTTPSSVTAMVLILLAAAGTAKAQERPQRPPRDSTTVIRTRPDSIRPDSGRAASQPIDTAAARKLGLPSQPARPLPSPDSVMQELLKRPGYRPTRYAADSMTFHAQTRQIDLTGTALVEREGSTLEADSVRFLQSDCRIDAAGSPKLFNQGTVLVGEGMQYDTCERRGIVAEALTRFDQSGVSWFLRGRLAIDSASTRVYAGRSSVTSSDLPLPDYHFSATQMKWVTNTIMVARPAVLYVRDVPVLWLPFIFQDLRRGRRSGMLVPRFGINDLVRPNRGYRRHISNVGYYVVLNNYADAQMALDWFAGTSVSLNGQLQYRWLDRFINGAVSLTRLYELGREGGGGSRSLHLLWSHQQSFDQRTRLAANIDYATSARVVQQNTIDPYLSTATLRSTANFSKQFGWGSLSVGGSRSQDLSSGVVTQAFPSVSLAPAPINLSNSITWTPSFSLSNDQVSNQFGGMLPGAPVGGIPVNDSVRFMTRNTSVQLSTPLRVGRWNWPNAVVMTHNYSNRRGTVTVPDPADTTRSFTRFYHEDFTTTVDWNPSIGLPTLFPSTWKLQPSVGIQNSTGGAFLLRNRYTGGDFVTQGKRWSLQASLTPTLFGFFPGVGPLSRIRHAVSPSARWGYAPPASVPAAYARAINPSGTQPQLRSPRSHSVGVGLSQTFEGKFRPPPGDTTGDQNARKIKILSVQTSGVEYDFEQAQEPGRSGWRTQNMDNQFTSDLLPGFSLSTSHELWNGPAGYDTTRFDVFLRRVSARFSISSTTVRGVLGMLTGRPGPATRQTPGDTTPPIPIPGARSPFGPRYGGLDRMQATGAAGVARPFTASVNFELDRPRPTAVVAATGALQVTRTVGLNMSFSPTPGWAASWDTQYNLTTNEFGQHVLRLDRDLGRWHATFAFLKAANGNFAFDFFVSLRDQPDIKFQYDQRTVRR